ncbi:unnamed protein product, partial [Mesorhabditis belari]|uniref:Calmodulin-binding domain-containing protein n=1 Tax=Mesorhabditis belari TaxID=2138241 RepID=A0AAF3JC19_9BILA
MFDPPYIDGTDRVEDSFADFSIFDKIQSNDEVNESLNFPAIDPEPIQRGEVYRKSHRNSDHGLLYRQAAYYGPTPPLAITPIPDGSPPPDEPIPTSSRASATSLEQKITSSQCCAHPRPTTVIGGPTTQVYVNCYPGKTTRTTVYRSPSLARGNSLYKQQSLAYSSRQSSVLRDSEYPSTITVRQGSRTSKGSRATLKSGNSCDRKESCLGALPSTMRTPLLGPQRKFSSVDNGYMQRSYYESIDRYLPYEMTVMSTKKRRGSKFPSLDNDKHLNGGVRFDPEVGGEPKQRSASTVRVIRRRQSGYGIAISSESTAKMRCRMRKLLFIRRNKICDLCLILAIAGLLFVVVDSELTALKKDTGIDKTHWASLLLRGAAVSSTISLMACLVNYHSIEVKIALIDSGADDWRVALSTDRILKLTLELIVCSICPFPGTGSINWPFISPETRKVTMISVPVDVLLSVPMFLRSYLLCRFMVLHSKQFQDAATRSIAALNRISMDFRFVIKTMMAEHPLRVLIVFTVTYWICMSWMFTQCERYDNKLNTEHYYMNSMWFIMVTFMSIGYGDIVPNTYCGRTLSIATGIVGAGVSSALIAVISRKLELSRAEKHVNNFMADSKLTNQRKNAAASVLQETWFIHKYKKSTNKGDELRLRHHQRRFLHSITEFRRIKWDQRKLQEKGNSLLDVGKLHADMHETLWEMHRTQDHFITQVDLLTQKIIELQNTLLQQGGHKTMPAMNSNQSTPQPNSIPPSFSLSRLNVPGGSQTPNTPSVTSSTNCIATGATTFANTQSVPIVSSPSDSHLFSNNNGQQQPGCINGTIYSQTNPTTPLMQSIDQD